MWAQTVVARTAHIIRASPDSPVQSNLATAPCKWAPLIPLARLSLPIGLDAAVNNMSGLHKGQMLVEMLLAIAISGIALVAVSQVTTRALSNTSFSRNRTLANAYVTEAMEWIRGYYKAEAVAMGAGGAYCLRTLTWPPTAGACVKTSCANQVDANCTFFRDVYFTPRDVGNVKQEEVKVVVSWKEGSSTTGSFYHTAQQVVNLSVY